jgi:hypothetical protein
MKMSSTDVNINGCEFENRIRLYSSQFYKKDDGKYYSFDYPMPTEVVKLSLDIDLRREQLRLENMKANRKCYCEKCNPETAL